MFDRKQPAKVHDQIQPIKNPPARRIFYYAENYFRHFLNEFTRA